MKSRINLTKKQKREIRKLICALVVFAGGFILSHAAPTAFPLNWIAVGLLLAAYVLAGYPVLMTAAKNIGHGRVFDENFLMSVATIGALALRQWDEAAAVMIFYNIGELFNDLAVNRSRRSISELMDIRPDYANLLKDGEETTVDPYDVQEGDLIRIKPGERVPLDGIITEGSAALDTSALTGESIPRDVTVGDEIASGCINMSGLLTVRVTGRFEESTVSRILDMVENAGNNKAEIEKFITRFARWYTPIVVFSALALALIPPLFIHGQAFSDWVYRALMFLVISCPCALVISVPLSFFGGVGAASKKGILVKGSSFLEAAADIDTILFDKTGTLTAGTFRVTNVRCDSDGMSRIKLLELTALAEYHSTHPISLSIKQQAEKEGCALDPHRITNVEELPGKGVKATIDGATVWAGNLKLMEHAGIKALTSDRESDSNRGSACASDHNSACESGSEIGSIQESDSDAALVFVAIDGIYAGVIEISDVLKEDTADAIRELKQYGVKNSVMLTGDRTAIAEKIAAATGVDSYKAELLPDEKVRAAEEIIEGAAGHVAFVGDGINDAPVLARADIGIAMGGMGSQAAVEAADIVIMDDKLSRLPEFLRIAGKTLGIARQNVAISLIVKAAVLILAALGIANMWMAIFADVGVCCIAILNAMRTLLIK